MCYVIYEWSPWKCNVNPSLLANIYFSIMKSTTQYNFLQFSYTMIRGRPLAHGLLSPWLAMSSRGRGSKIVDFTCKKDDIVYEPPFREFFFIISRFTELMYLHSCMKCFFGRYEEYPFFSFCFGLTYFKLIDQKFDSPIHMLRFDFVLHILSDKSIRAIVNDENVRIG